MRCLLFLRLALMFRFFGFWNRDDWAGEVS